MPIRPAGFDYKRAMPGNTSKAEWQGIHTFDELLQVHNPPQGYMQNCNVSPQFLMKDSGLKPLSRYKRSDRVVRRAGGPIEHLGRPPDTNGQ